MTDPGQNEATRLLAAHARGEGGALDALLALVYDELRRLAGQALLRERSGHTLQPTALVHECYLKLVGQSAARFESTDHFLAVAATAMRRILVNHAEAHGARKRGGDRHRITLYPDVVSVGHGGEGGLDLLDLDAALKKLSDLDPRKAKVVEMRYFAGLEVAETASALGISAATVKRDFDYARVWLLREVSRE